MTVNNCIVAVYVFCALER